jgi:hypothetical protein
LISFVIIVWRNEAGEPVFPTAVRPACRCDSNLERSWLSRRIEPQLFDRDCDFFRFGWQRSSSGTLTGAARLLTWLSVRCDGIGAKRSITHRLELCVMKKAAVTLRLEPELLERVEALAREERRPLQNIAGWPRDEQNP